MSIEQETTRITLPLRAADFYLAAQKILPEVGLSVNTLPDYIPTAIRELTERIMSPGSDVFAVAYGEEREIKDAFAEDVVFGMTAISGEKRRDAALRLIEQLQFVKSHASKIIKISALLRKNGIKGISIPDENGQAHQIDFEQPDFSRTAFKMAANQVASCCGSPRTPTTVGSGYYPSARKIA